jgi:ribosomal protein S17
LNLGDTVTISETKPISKTKHFQVVSVEKVGGEA